MPRFLADLAKLVPFRIVRVRNGLAEDVPGHQCVVPDNHVQTFVVRLRSIGGVRPQQLKDQLQRKWEVLGQPEIIQANMIVR